VKKIIKIEIEVPENIAILPDEGTTEDDYTTKELKTFRKDYAEELVKYAENRIRSYIDDVFEEDFMDNLEENSIEDWDDFSDYKVKIKMV